MRLLECGTSSVSPRHPLFRQFLVANPNPREVNLEHILPKKLSVGWEHVDEERHTAYLDRIGNLALLTNPKNIRNSNRPYTEKLKVYALSELVLTRMIYEEYPDGWGPTEIEDRQRRLAELAVKAWPLPSTTLSRSLRPSV